MTNHRLHVLFVLLACAPMAAQKPVDLPGTTIELPWKLFNDMLAKKTDTVFASPGSASPVPIAVTGLAAEIRLLDSCAQATMVIGYSVLDTSRWSTTRLFKNETDLSFTSISMPRGDYLCCTDTGYILIAGANKPQVARSAKLALIKNAEIEAGVCRIELPLPDASDRSMTVVTPPDFLDVSFETATLISKRPTGAAVRYFCAIPSRSDRVTIRYTHPIRQNAAAPQLETYTVHKKPMISVVHETGLFVSDNSAFVVAALHMTVAQAPITHFSIMLPGAFSLLKIEGAGIKTWAQGKGGVIDVSLSFACKDHYTFFLIGETSIDSPALVPSFSIAEAKRQTGRFAVMADNNSEADAIAVENCVNVSPAQFLKKSTPEFTAKCVENKKNPDAAILAGETYAAPYVARFRFTRHQPVPVVNALVDLGVLRTIIGDDRKVLTMASFAIRQRERQFLSLSLGDSCDLWAVTLDGNAVAPFGDSDGTYKISLQRFLAARNTERPVLLTLTYLSHPDFAKAPLRCKLNAPALDVPINKLEWTVFYPQRWGIKKVTGDFTTKSALLGKPAPAPDAEESRKLLAKLRQSVEQQNAGGPAAKLFNEPSKTIFAYKILVINEHPKIEIYFGTQMTPVFFLLAGVALLIMALLLIRGKLRKQMSLSRN